MSLQFLVLVLLSFHWSRPSTVGAFAFACAASASASASPSLSVSHSVALSASASTSRSLPVPQRTFVCLKPDAYERRVLGRVVSRLEDKGLRLLGLKLRPRPALSLAETRRHYEQHRMQPFYPALLDFFASGPLLTMVWEGVDAVQLVRRLVGGTRPVDALPGTIRGDFCLETQRNLIHCSDSIEAAEREIGIWFPSEDDLAPPLTPTNKLPCEGGAE